MKTLHALDAESWLATVWHALECYRGDCIPEGQDVAYDDAWSDICSAMAWIRTGLGLPDEISADETAQPAPASYDDDLIHTALCVWEALLDRENSITAIERLRRDIGTVEMRALAISLAPFCEQVFAELPDFLTYDKGYDLEIVPVILDTVDFTARPVTAPPLSSAVEAVKKILAT